MNIRNMLRIVLLGLSLAGVSPTLFPENLMFNAGFELGGAGYQCIKNLRPDRNPDLVYEAPMADPSTRVSGKQSLKIPNRFAEAIYFSSYFHAERVKPNTAYALSVWLKSSAGNYPAVLIARSSTRWTSYATSVIRIGKEWERFVVNFKTDQAVDYFRFVLLCGKEDAPCDLWMDDVALVADGEAPDNPGLSGFPKVEPLFIQDGALKEIPVAVEFENQLPRPGAASLQVSVTNPFTQQRVFATELPVDLSTAGIKNLRLAIPASIGYGSYRVALSSGGAGGRWMQGTFAISGKYQPKAVDIDQDFCLSLNDQGGMEGGLAIATPFWADYWSKAVPELKVARGMVASGPLEAKYALVQRMGCRLLRLWSPGNIRWSQVEPEEGRFDFSPIDRTLRMTERHGMKVLLVLGNMDFMDVNTGAEYANGSLPDWLKDKSEVREKFPIKGKYTKGRVYLPPMDLWERYVRKTVAYCAGRVTHYELMNEPNLIFSDPADYLGYAKAAAAILKEYGKKRVGPCTTGDLGGQATTFLGQFISGKGLDFVDIVSFHPYDAKELSSRMPADKQIQEFKALVEQAGERPTPLWNTELYFMDSKSKTTVERDSKPYHPARRILIDLGEGVRQSINQTLQSLWNTEFHPGQMEYPQTIILPSTVYVSLNALARLFEGAVPVAKFRWPEESICYVYKREGAAMAAYWNYGEAPTSTARLQTRLRDSVTLVDLCGNRLAFDGVSLPLGQAPCYLVDSAPGGAELLVLALKEATLVGVDANEGKKPAGAEWGPVKLLIDDFEAPKAWVVGSTVAGGPSAKTEMVGPDGVAGLPQGKQALKVDFSAESFVEGQTTHKTPCVRTIFDMKKVDGSVSTLSFWLRAEQDMSLTIGLPKKDWSDRLTTTLRLKKTDGWKKFALSMEGDFRLSEKKWPLGELKGELWFYNRSVPAGGTLNPAGVVYLDEVALR
ncbi:MAG: beta-galactosidase [Spirochaetes bacterium]|nr:beta-galactosidase [Spirochaetota bacterium]